MCVLAHPQVMARVHKQEMGVVRAHIDSALMTRDEEAALAREVEVQVEALGGEKDVLINDLAAESELHNAHKACCSFSLLTPST